MGRSPVKAFLLAAGLGTRLRPLTDTVPKCLVPIDGRPLLAYWIDLFERHGVTDVLINLHHLPDPVRAFVEAYRGPVRFELVMEPVLLGSAGTLQTNRAFVDGEEQFFILYADNLTNADLSALREFNAAHPAPLTVGLLHMERPETRGIATLDEEGTIVEFIEKPQHPKSDLASAGIFVGRPGLFGYFEDHAYPYDFGNHVMPSLVGAMNGLLVEGYLRDVGTHEDLARAAREWKSLSQADRAQ
jgi:mannose-1-phosphate guanylyltransferase